MSYGFVRVGAAVPKLRVADSGYNAARILELVLEAESKGVQIIVFPELSLTAYTCGDLFHQHTLLREAEARLGELLEKTETADIVVIAGMPLVVDNQLFNCGIAIQHGKILGAVPKTYIPNYKEFYEERWFAPGTKVVSPTAVLCGQEIPVGPDLIFEASQDRTVSFGIEVCEDMWVPVPPSSHQAIAGAALLFNLSASNEVIGKHEYRRDLIKQQSGRCVAGYVFASCGIHESTTDVVFGGYAAIAENGGIIAESDRFGRDSLLIYSDVDVEHLVNDRFKNTSFMEAEPPRRFRRVKFDLKPGNLNLYPASFKRYTDPHPFVPSDPERRDERCSEIFSIQTAGLAKRLEHSGLSHVVIGISGGLDSTLALLVAARTFDLLNLSRENIIAVTMPGFGTTDVTYTNALRLMSEMKVTTREISIKEACLGHFRDIGHDPAVHDVTYENVQARERTQILMDIANKEGGLVVGTGDLSELALGWSTYNGDHMSMYAVNCGIPKTLVKYLVSWVADNVVEEGARDVLYRVLDTPITPELLPPDEEGKINQKTEDIVGPYELHDFFLYHMVRYGAGPKKIMFLAMQAFGGRYEEAVIKNWLKVFYRRFFTQQFKRSCLPDGPKVGSISLSPRGDWRMPSDAKADVWLRELE